MAFVETCPRVNIYLEATAAHGVRLHPFFLHYVSDSCSVCLAYYTDLEDVALYFCLQRNIPDEIRSCGISSLCLANHAIQPTVNRRRRIDLLQKLILKTVL